MWKLVLQCPSRHVFRSILSFGNLSNKVFIGHFHIQRTSLLKQCTERIHQVPTVKPKTIEFSVFAKIGWGLTTSSVLQLSCLRTAKCHGKSRISTVERPQEQNLKFDWNKFWYYLYPQIWYIVLGILGALMVAILNINIPHVLGDIINVIARFHEKTDNRDFLKAMRGPAACLILMYIAQSVFTFQYIYLLAGAGERMAHHIKTDLLASVLKQDIAFFDKHRTGEILTRLTADIQDFKSSFKQSISGGLRSFTQIIGCAFSLFAISAQMATITMLCIPSVILAGSLVGAVLRKLSRNAQAQVERTTAVAEEALGNIRTVRAFAMEDHEQALYEGESAQVCMLNQNLGFGVAVFQAGTSMFLNGMVLSTLYMGGYLLSTEHLTAGQLMAFLLATQTIQRSLSQLSLLFGAVIKGLASGARVFEYINMETTMPLRGGDIIPAEHLKGDISFNSVTFAYPSRPEFIVLKEFNLKIPAGKTVALVGASGNGKSTVVGLLERFYDVNSGSITIDGRNITSLDPSWLRQRTLGLIGQEPVLFATSVRENIRYGKLDATDEEVENAAQLANAHQFIVAFPHGYETMVGERGASLSGGQKQRIAIARALLKNPAILILDEATSALDSESENVVQTALDRARQGRTVLVIAHRLSTVQNADTIVVIDKGKIVEIGTHESLSRLKGTYWNLTQIQQKSEAG